MIKFPDTDWKKLLESTLNDEQTQFLFRQVEQLYQIQTVLPQQSQIFNAFKSTSYANTRVVILGQDPYPTPNNAMGLSFSVPTECKIPGSLRNIFKERFTDIQIPVTQNGDLTAWTQQGVLLLNTILTVQAHKPESHKWLDWQHLTTAAIKVLNDKSEPVVFVLWGNKAKKYAKFITNPNHLIISSSHPSSLGAYRLPTPFIGSHPFSQINRFLHDTNQTPINWQN